MPLSSQEFEVTLEKTGYRSSVNLKKKLAHVLNFQKSGIPCCHAIAAIMSRELQRSEFVAATT